MTNANIEVKQDEVITVANANIKAKQDESADEVFTLSFEPTVLLDRKKFKNEDDFLEHTLKVVADKNKAKEEKASWLRKHNKPKKVNLLLSSGTYKKFQSKVDDENKKLEKYRTYSNVIDELLDAYNAGKVFVSRADKMIFDKYSKVISDNAQSRKCSDNKVLDIMKADTEKRNAENIDTPPQ